MKLYATTTSERASKGQGGNKFIQADIRVIDRDIPVLSLMVEIIDDNKYYVRLTDYEKDRIIFAEQRQLKGKRQKGD